jgi:L-threonylcarbamoyladenylate synthase
VVLSEILPSDARRIESSAMALREGFLVAFPTETVYGLGADISHRASVDRVFEVKGRPKDHPLIVHIGEIEQIEEIAIIQSQLAKEVIDAFWPGPLTLVLKKTRLVNDNVTGGLDSIAIRMPRHESALALLKFFHNFGGLGVAAPSANKYGKTSPTSARDVLEDLGEFLTPNDVILDGGQSECGLESTILDLTLSVPTIRRLGSISVNSIENVLGEVDIDLKGKSGRISGSDVSHYAPRARVHLSGEGLTFAGFIAMQNIPTPPGFFRIATPTSVEEYAHILYQSFREADRKSLSDVVAIPPDGVGLAEAIRDRISRASS